MSENELSPKKVVALATKTLSEIKNAIGEDHHIIQAVLSEINSQVNIELKIKLWGSNVKDY